MSFVCNDSLNFEALLNAGEVFSVFLLSEKLPSSYSVQTLNCSFSSIIHFCPQRFLRCSILRKKMTIYTQD